MIRVYKVSKRLVFAVLAAVTLAVSAAVARAGPIIVGDKGLVAPDRAVIVGVDSYTTLPAEAQLAGCDNDADAVAARLQGMGFSVTEIKDATRAQIVAALTSTAKSPVAAGRFVFYFAGHGDLTPDGQGCILPADAQRGDIESVIGRDDLYRAVHAIPARDRTIVLDSCFSGAMPQAYGRFKSIHPAVRYRCWDLFGGSKSITVVNRREEPIALAGEDDVCYFVACDPHQRALEAEIGGRPRGVFTYYLCTRLDSTKQLWETVQAATTSDVMAYSDGSESPVLSAGFAGHTVFGGDAVKAAPTDSSVWDAFNATRDDPGKLTFAMTPNLTTVAMGQQFSLTATPKIDGYLVVMELDTTGAVNLLFPPGRDAAQAKVSAGSTVSLPADAGQAYTVNAQGMENVRAILFRSSGDAENLLSAFPTGLSLGDTAKTARTVRLPDAPSAFYTASLSFEVSGTQ